MKSTASQSNSKKELDDDDDDDDDYCVTENPMDNQTDIQQNVQSSDIVNHNMEPNQLDTPHNIDSEYHYIEPDHTSSKIDTTQNIQGEIHYAEPDHNSNRVSTSQYESLPDSPLGKNALSPYKDEAQQYDYTTCAKSSNQFPQTVRHGGAQATNQNSTKAAATKNLWNVAETVYDHADTQGTVVNRFLGVNEYQHISPCAARRKVALDTYNTVGDVCDGTKKEDDDDDCGYDIARR